MPQSRAAVTDQESGKTGVCAGIVGYADLALGTTVETVLEAMIEASGGRFRRIRFITASHPDQAARGSPIIRPAGLLVHPSVREGFPASPRSASASTPGCITPSSASWSTWRAPFPRHKSCSTMSVARSASALMPASATRFSLNGARRSASWRPAQCPCQARRARHAMFGFTHHMGELPPSSEELAIAWRPYIETCIAALRPERTMFESNFPVDKGSCSYHVLWNAFKRIAAGCSAAVKYALFAGMATKFYKLE